MAVLHVFALCAAACLLAAPVAALEIEDITKAVSLQLQDFTVGVLEHKMPWIIAFTAGDESAEATALAESLDALGRVGIVNTKKRTDILKRLNLQKENVPAWRVYGFGDKSAEGADFKTAEEAKAALLASIPKDIVAVAPSQGVFQEALVGAIQAGLVPLLFFAEGKEPPALLSKMAVWFPDSYKVIYMPDAADDIKKSFNVEKLPHMHLMLATPDGASGQMGFRTVPYDRAKFGAYKFKNLLRFMIQAEMELRKGNMWPEKPEAAQKPAKTAPVADIPKEAVFEITAENSAEACPASKLGLCIIALLDGHPDNTALQSQVDVLTKAQDLPSNKGRVLHFMWVDVRCHPTFGAEFGISVDSAPTLIAVSPKKSRFAQHISVFDPEHIAVFISGVLSGKTSIAPYKALPAVGTEDCAALYSAGAPAAAGDEFDLNDILGEDVGEDERKQVDEGADAARQAAEAAAEKAERELKERIAREEVERLNKKSKKKSKKAKTEL